MVLFLVTVLALFGLGSTQPTNGCPAGIPRDEYLTVYNGLCYQFVVSDEETYSGAETTCGHHGGILVVVKSQDLTDYLVDKLIYDYGYGNKVWIGLSDKAHEGDYVWADDSPLDFTNWQANAGPNSNTTSGVEDCVTLIPSADGKWDDDVCEDSFFGLIEHRHSFICQYKPRHVPATNVPATNVPAIAETTTPSEVIVG